MSKKLTISVLGGGSFGTAIANTIAQNGFDVNQWMRDKERAENTQSTRINQTYLPDFTLSDSLTVTSELIETVEKSDLIFVSVPSAAFRDILLSIKSYVKPSAFMVSTTKGIAQRRSGQRQTQDGKGFVTMSDLLKEALPDNAFGVLSGPNFAREIMEGQITGTVIASEQPPLIKSVQACFGSEKTRIYSSEDYYGVELAGALKNIYAIIAGMAEARDYGHNTMALLLTRALAEMGRFAYRLGADPMTFLGLSGVGDLFLTCTSNLSRNYRVGHALGSGQTLTGAMRATGQAVEGVNTLRLVKEKAKLLGISMPLAEALYALLFEGASADSIIKQLMLSEQNSDVDFTGAIR